jgi:hypothetical protein
MAKSSPLNNVKKPTSDGCNVEHVVTDNLGRTEREKKNPVRRRRQFRAKKKKKNLSVEVPKPRFQVLEFQDLDGRTHGRTRQLIYKM